MHTNKIPNMRGYRITFYLQARTNILRAVSLPLLHTLFLTPSRWLSQVSLHRLFVSRSYTTIYASGSGCIGDDGGGEGLGGWVLVAGFRRDSIIAFGGISKARYPNAEIKLSEQ